MVGPLLAVINYISLSGALAASGPAEGGPVPPLNLLGDYGGGSLYLVAGILAAIIEAQRSGQGQVIDAAICDGVNSLMDLFHAQALRGTCQEQRSANVLDGGAPYYTVYETADAGHVSLGPIEPKFFALLCDKIGLPEALRDAQNDRARWPALHQAMAGIFKTRSRADWCALREGSDVCFAPVLGLSEAANHQARGAFTDVGGVRHPAPAPRFSRTPCAIQGAAPTTAVLAQELLQRWQ